VKTLKNVGVTIVTILIVYFGLAIFTYPTGVMAAISDPWEAITLLTERVTQLEWRVARMEKILGLDQENHEKPAGSFYTEEDLRNSPLINEEVPFKIKEKIEKHKELELPKEGHEWAELEDYHYAATIPPDLEGIIKARYMFWITVHEAGIRQGKPVIIVNFHTPAIIENLTDQYLIISYTSLGTIRDETGEIISQEELGPEAGHEATFSILRPCEIIKGDFFTGIPKKRLDINSISIEWELKDIRWKAFSSKENLDKALKYINENPWTNTEEYKELFPKIWEYIDALE